MSETIINLRDWLPTAPGQALLRWEQAQIDKAVADVFGFHALQIGLPELSALQANRMPHQWCADREGSCSIQLRCDVEALPFPAASLDLLVMPHSLEYSLDPHESLREAERVLVPEGRLVICGFNPTSLWAWRQKRAHFYQRFGLGKLYLPREGEFIGYWRLRDWLRLLGFEVESAFGNPPWTRKSGWRVTNG
jgi:SAM-dependent methyltransferase